MNTNILVCQQCGEEFIVIRYDAKYCSSACRQAAYYLRVRNFRAEELRNNNAYAQMMLDKFNAAQAHKRGMAGASNSSNLVRGQIENKKVEVDNAMNAPADGLSKMFEAFEQKMKEDKVQRDTERANKRLKEALAKLIECTQEEEISTLRLKFSLSSIERKLSTSYFTPPENYKYTSFVSNELMPRVTRLLKLVNKEESRKIRLDLSEEFETRIREVENEIA